MESLKEVMVTYSWDGNEHQQTVIAFIQFLREKGFESDIDVKLAQSQTSIDFTEMIHRSLAEYSKIIIILSKGYKLKAENFIGGVGQEYRIILSDIERNPTKYILVSFEALSNDIIPIGFDNRDVVDMTRSGSLDKLFRKLMNLEEYTFSKVGKEKPVIPSKMVAPYRPVNEGSPIEIVKICCGRTLSQTQFHQMKRLIVPCHVEIRNTGQHTLTDIQLEIIMPTLLLEGCSNHTVIGNEVILNFEFKKAFSGQPLRSKEFTMVFTNFNVQLINTPVTVKVYTDEGTSERKFIVKDFVIVYDLDQSRPPVTLSEDLFF
jgi:hypothetical protein